MQALLVFAFVCLFILRWGSCGFGFDCLLLAVIVDLLSCRGWVVDVVVSVGLMTLVAASGWVVDLMCGVFW